MKKIFFIIGLGIATLSTTSCREADLEPTLAQEKELDASLVTTSDIQTYMNGIYEITKNVDYLGRAYNIYGEVRSDNAFANGNSNRYIIEAEMNYTADNGDMPATWYRIYQVIGRANLLINKYEGVGGYTPLSGNEAQIKYYVGQAYILRAMAHFDLVRIFGQQYVSGEGGMNSLGIPYMKHFKGDPNNLYPARNTVQEVYDNAKKDVETALSLMSTSLDTRPNYYVSTNAGYALLSRMATYFNDSQLAESASKKIIDGGAYTIPEGASYVNSWKGQTSSNWIFSLYFNTSAEALGINSLAYIYRLPQSGGGYGDIEALENLYNIFSSNDIRRSNDMFGIQKGVYRNIGKYPDTTAGGDAIPVFRYEEVILNYAEALLKNGKATEALTYLNMIPQKRGAELYTVANMDNILLERRKEFAFEGFRFHDLVRSGKDIPVLDDLKQRMKPENAKAGSPKLAFPIPNTEMGANANMVQNKSYK